MEVEVKQISARMKYERLLRSGLFANEIKANSAQRAAYCGALPQ